MGKRKTREPENPFQTDSECLTQRHPKLDKLRHDLWLMVLKQPKLVKLIRDEIPDSFNHETRNLIHSTSHILLFHIDKVEEVVTNTWDHSVKRFQNTKATKKARN